MIRTLIWGGIFGLGVWAGTELAGVTEGERCINAGGTPDDRGFCVAPD